MLFSFSTNFTKDTEEWEKGQPKNKNKNKNKNIKIKIKIKIKQSTYSPIVTFRPQTTTSRE
jgi:hypothetical protein